MKYTVLSMGLISILFALWPAHSWATVQQQDSGTIPAPTATELPVLLTLEALFTRPEAVVIDEPFNLIVSIRNPTPFAIHDLTISYRDVAEDQALVAVVGSKTDTGPILGPNLAITIYKELRYLLDEPGRREIEVLFRYTYTVDGQVIARTQTVSVVFRVLAPTPTPTVTWTPTPIPTLTPNLLATFEFIRNRVATATAQAFALTPSATPAPPIVVVATPTPSKNGESSPTPSEPLQEAGGGSGVRVDARPALVVEFADVPLTVQPGAIFTMSLVVRNISTATVTAVVATWNTFSNGAIVPIGVGTHWVLPAIHPGDKQSVAGQFYVQEATLDGIQKVEVTVDYHNAAKAADGEVNLLVQRRTPTATPTPSNAEQPPAAEEPFWLRILRALFGDTRP